MRKSSPIAEALRSWIGDYARLSVAKRCAAASAAKQAGSPVLMRFARTTLITYRAMPTALCFVSTSVS